LPGRELPFTPFFFSSLPCSSASLASCVLVLAPPFSPLFFCEISSRIFSPLSSPFALPDPICTFISFLQNHPIFLPAGYFFSSPLPLEFLLEEVPGSEFFEAEPFFLCSLMFLEDHFLSLRSPPLFSTSFSFPLGVFFCSLCSSAVERFSYSNLVTQTARIMSFFSSCKKPAGTPLPPPTNLAACFCSPCSLSEYWAYLQPSFASVYLMPRSSCPSVNQFFSGFLSAGNALDPPRAHFSLPHLSHISLLLPCASSVRVLQ